MLALLWPTGDRSQIRVRTGIPLFRNRSIHKYVDNTLPDPYVSIEHDWMWRYFGFTVGLAYMYLQEFAREDYPDYYAVEDKDTTGETYYTYCRVQTSERYDSKQAFNSVLGLRIGLDDIGLYGRLSVPLAFNLPNKDPRNYCIEYSLFGVYGWNNNVISLGITGMTKHREPDPESIIPAGTPDTLSFEQFEKGFYRDDNMTNEFYLMFPCLRYGRLIGEKVIIAFSLELGGLLFPRLMLPDFFGYEDGIYTNPDKKEDHADNRYWWKPSVGLQFVYSFGTLRGPLVVDGSF